MRSFETSAIVPGQLYQVRASCTFAGENFDTKFDATQAAARLIYYDVPGGALLLALGCYRNDALSDDESVLGCQFIFKFLWKEKVVCLPLTCKQTFGHEAMAELQEGLDQGLGLFLRAITKKSDVIEEEST